MDWLRRNWPDLLIGLALVAVIAGIVATLLTGGSFFPLGESTTSAALERPAPSQEDGVDPSEPDAAGLPGAGPSEADGGAAAAGNGSGATGSATDGSDADAGGGSDAEGPGVAVLPPNDQEDGASGPSAGDPSEAEAATPSDPEPQDAADRAGAQPLPIDEETATSSEASAASGEGATSSAPETAAQDPANEGLPTDPFRVSVGAFSSSDNAERQAERFRDEGYPVFVGAQGELSIVLVGPYQQRPQAEQVAAEIAEQHEDVDPVIYRYEPEGDVQGGGTGVGTAETRASAAAGEPTADGAAPAATSSGVRLQVGAYATPDSAAPQIERLDGLGFHQVEQVRDGGLIRLMVGPYRGEALEDARTLLQGAGIEHFPR